MATITTRRQEFLLLAIAWGSALLLQGSLADYEKVCSQDVVFQPSRYLCGSQLSAVLRTLCTDGYHHTYKRSALNKLHASDARGQGLSMDPSKNQDLIMSKDPAVFLSKASAMSYLHHKRTAGEWEGQLYRRQGIVCECCYHQCSVAELRQYCAAPSPSLSYGKKWAALPIVSQPERHPASNNAQKTDEPTFNSDESSTVSERNLESNDSL